MLDQGAVVVPGLLNTEWREWLEEVVEDRVAHPWIGRYPGYTDIVYFV